VCDFPQGSRTLLIIYKDPGQLSAKFVPWLFPAELSEIAIYLRIPPNLTPLKPPIFAYVTVKKCQFSKIANAFKVTILALPTFFNFVSQN
jgi:hypothetical protein